MKAEPNARQGDGASHEPPGDSFATAATGDAARTIAHDLNNLLAVVLGYAELAARNEELPEAVRTSIDEITRAAQGGRELVERLRTLGRKGTSGSVDSPLPATRVANPGKPAVPNRAAHTPQRILYLDDDAPLVSLVVRGLKELGHRVSGFVSTEEALAAIHANTDDYDLVVTDYSMPIVSGLDVARQIAALNPELRVVLTSGAVSSELRETCARLGVCELLEKSVSIQELCAAIDAMLASPDPS